MDATAGTIFSVMDSSEGRNTTLTADLSNLLAEGLYINVHTATYGSGEIRGQIVPEPSGLLMAGIGLGLLLLLGRRRRTG